MAMHALSQFNLNHLTALLNEGTDINLDPLVPGSLAADIQRLQTLEHATVYCEAGVWTRLPLSHQFQQRAEQWSAQVATMSSDPVAQVNGWAKTATDGMIDEVVQDLTDVDVVAATALALRSRWALSMNESTMDWDGRTVASVNKTANIAVGGQPGEWCVRLPLGDDGLSVRIRMNRADYEESKHYARLDFPAFHAEQRHDIFDVLPTIVTEADYRGMLEHPERLLIGAGSHNVVIDCDHAGVAAAAVSVVSLMRAAARMDTPLKVTIDEPFLFEVWHHEALLFEAWIDEIIPARPTHADT